MKNIFRIFFTLFFYCSVSAQPFVHNTTQPSGSGNVYALIVGISNYLEPDIQQLQFANRDAEVFSDFLQSKGGGAVPKENIRLLTDSNATTAAVYNAIYWLKKTAKKDDMVFFYFSGHGGLENITMFNDAYLICYNSPQVNYVGMALSVEYLNKVANTLSAETDTKVILITDACHSGKITDAQYKTNQLIGEKLMATNEKEIRIASCTFDQLSNEKVDWGGGRGVFSYYLVNGLKGLADKSNDGIVTVGEIKSYLENALKTDPVLKQENKVQTPVFKGDDGFPISNVDRTEMVQARTMVSTDSIRIVNALPTLPADDNEIDADPDEYFLSLLKQESLEALTDSLKLDKLAAGEIAFALINKIKDSITAETGLKKLAKLEKELRNNNETLTRFNGRLAVVFADKGQEIISEYLKGDEAELERRRYYNYNKSGYDVYPRMFAVALKLIPADDAYHNILEVILHYFTGVSLRLKVPGSDKPAVLIEQALAEQTKALELEKHAAYIYNELGILYQYKKEIAKAEDILKKATELTPGWAIPWSNLSALYSLTGKYEQGFATCKIADSLQPGLQNNTVNFGFLNEKTGNLLYAEEDYRNAIDINSRHYLPFERLGYVYLNTTDYAQADSFFYEASLRKKGLHFDGNEWLQATVIRVAPAHQLMACNVDTLILKPYDFMAFFTWGVQEYEKGDYANAVRILKRVIAVDKKNPLVFHYLGKIFYDQQKWEEAEVMFKYAISYYLDEDEFNRFCDSSNASRTYPYDHSCFEAFFKSRYYEKIEDFYFAGTVYENWKHYEEAELFYNKIISIASVYDKQGGYLKLWKMLERLGRYTEAEAIIKKSARIPGEESENVDRELNEFYRRTIEKFPDRAEWVYKLGLLLYKRASFNARAPFFDSIVSFPKINKEVFIDFDVYNKLGNDDNLRLDTRSMTKFPDSIKKDAIKEDRRTFIIPGTEESIDLADAIYLPRKDGIKYLTRTAELLTDREAIADVNFKIGNIYVWAGSKKQSFPYYVKSIELVPANASARLHLIDVGKAIYKNRVVLEQLNYLYDSSEINFENRILFAEFTMYAGQFEKSKKILDEAIVIHPYALPVFYDLQGRLNLLSKKYDKAILFYQDYLNDKPDDANGYYTIARLYAGSGKNMEALKWLKSAFDKGFNYSFILESDPLMNDLRKTNKWNSLIKNTTMKAYHAQSIN